MKPAFLALLTMAAVATGQSVFRSDTWVVEVAVVATRGDGSPVTDLRTDEIRLLDNNREQTIGSFERVGDGGSAGSASSESPRRSIILLDALNTGWAAQGYGREAVSQMLAKLPQGAGRIAILALGDELHVLHDFSIDMPSLQASVDDYDGEQPGESGIATLTTRSP